MSEVTNVNDLSPGEEVTVTRGTETVFSGTVSSVGTSEWAGGHYADIEIEAGEFRSLWNNAGHHCNGLVRKGINYRGAVTVRRV